MRPASLPRGVATARVLSTASRIARGVTILGLLTGCTVLPDVTAFSAATENMAATTDLAFVEARQVVTQGMLATLEPGDRAALAVSLSGVGGKQLSTDCECVRAEDSDLERCLSSPLYRSQAAGDAALDADQFEVLGGLVCLELAHRQIGLFRSGAKSYSGSLTKLVDAGKGGATAAESLLASVNGLAGVLGASGLVAGKAADVFVAFYDEWARSRSRQKLRQVLPTTDLAIADLEKLLLEALDHLESSLDAGALGMRTELDADADRWLVATSRDLATSEKAAMDFLVHDFIGPQPPSAKAKYLEGLQRLDAALGAMQPSIVFECHPEAGLEGDVVCRADGVAHDYDAASCDNEDIDPDDELFSACCLKAESCCEADDCLDLATLLDRRTKHWQNRLKELGQVKKLFPADRHTNYVERRRAAFANEQEARASLAAARVAVRSWAASHRVVAQAAGSVERAE